MNNDTTYALLVQSEEKGRSIMETAIYALLGLSAILSILQFVQQPNRLPMTLTHPDVRNVGDLAAELKQRGFEGQAFNRRPLRALGTRGSYSCLALWARRRNPGVRTGFVKGFDNE